MKLTPIVLILGFLYSCSDGSKDTSIKGKWAGITDGEYYEMHITPNEVNVFSLWMGNRGSFRYAFTTDSIYYPDLEYAFAYKKLNDSMLVFQSEVTDTLYKLANTALVFDEINHKDSLEFNSFFESYFSRAKSLYSKVGNDLEEVLDYNDDEVFDFDMEPEESDLTGQ